MSLSKVQTRQVQDLEKFLDVGNNTVDDSALHNKIIELKNKMNTSRINFNRPESSKILISKHWLLGFIEGECTFGFKNLTPFLQVGQNVISLYVVEAIANYLKSIPKGFKFSLRLLIV